MEEEGEDNNDQLLEEEKPHKIKSSKWNCRLCDKSFSQKSDLNRHVDGVHLKLKSFTKKAYQTGHVHYNLKSFSCTLCDKSFSRKGQLIGHMAAVHNHIRAFPCIL